MDHQVIKHKTLQWHHFSKLKEKDIQYLEKEFKFHPLDFEDLRNDHELPKLETHKYYLFTIFTIPTFDPRTMHVGGRNLAVFIGKNYIITATKEPIEAVDRYFARAKRSQRLKKESMSKSSGYLTYRLLDYIFRDSKVILQELVREATNVERAVYDTRTKVTTKRLGIIRRNILFMRHIIDPQRILIGQVKNTKKTFISTDLELFYDDVKDTLDSIWVVTDNLKNIMDGLFDVNEALLSHKTNEIIRFLTVISVILMPPTLITGYYGMNVEKLPFGNNAIIISLIVLLSVLVFILVIMRIDRRK